MQILFLDRFANVLIYFPGGQVEEKDQSCPYKLINTFSPNIDRGISCFPKSGPEKSALNLF